MGVAARGPALAENEIAGEHIVNRSSARKSPRTGLLGQSPRGRGLAAEAPQRAGQGGQGLVVQGHGPGACM